MANHTLDASASGSRLALRPLDEVTVKLAENPSTGYAWLLAALDPAVVSHKSSYQADPEPADAGGEPWAGGGGIRSFSFRAVGPGSISILLTYKRAWMPDKADDQHFELKVTISG